MQNWQWAESAGIKYITVPEWTRQGANMMFTSRRQGNSDEPFDSLNLALHVGDDHEAVIRNRQLIMNVWGRPINDLICCQQVHGNRIAVIDNADKGKGSWAYDSALGGYDGMITSTPGVYLALFFADCLPVFLFDSNKGVIGLVHCGWKGTMGEIILAAITGMQQQYQVEPGNIQAFIGPGIGSCCFEINRELADQVNLKFYDFKHILRDDQGRILWDLTLTNYYLLQEAGLNKENIITAELCTKCRPDLFFSYREAGGITGRMGAVIGLR